MREYLEQLLIVLAIVKEYEPVPLLPIGFGCILANIPLSGMAASDEHGMFGLLYQAGVLTELFPLLIFIGVGAMIDFSPLLSQPRSATSTDHPSLGWPAPSRAGSTDPSRRSHS